MKILIIDDNKDLTKMFKQYFTKTGNTCVVSNDGPSGLLILQSQKFEVIILDLAMPDFSGKDVVVVGGGNAAFESASQLLAYCKTVTLINRSGKFRADPVTIDIVSKNPHFKIITDAVPKQVKGDTFVSGFVYTDVKRKAQ